MKYHYVLYHQKSYVGFSSILSQAQASDSYQKFIPGDSYNHLVNWLADARRRVGF